MARLPAHWWPVTTRWNGSRRLTAPVGERGQVGRVYLVVPSVSWLRRILAEPAVQTPVHRVTLKVLHWRAPRAGWSGRLGPLPSVRMHRAVLPPPGYGPAQVEIRLAQAVPLYDVLVAALAVLTPVRPVPRPMSADVTALGSAPAWLPPQSIHTVTAGPLRENPEIRPYDLVLSGDRAETADELAGMTAAAEHNTVRAVDRQPRVLIDSRVANPVGRRRSEGGDTALARLEIDPDGSWRLLGGDDELPRGALSRIPLTMHQMHQIRYVGNIRCDLIPEVDPVAEATLIAQLAATGAVLDLPPLRPSVADLLAPELRELLDAPLPERVDEPMRWEIRSVAQRRAALRGHAASFALGVEVASGFPGLVDPPSVSAILVTRRPDYVADAVAYIARQTYPNLEIVLCMHGVELSAQLRAQLQDCGRPLEIFTAPSALSFGEVMGVATARARGSLVTKFDDDDVYGPEHVWDLVLAREFSGAEMVGKAAEFVYLQMLDVTIRRLALPPETYGPPVAGGTMLMSRGDLEEIGGWRPVPRSVDRGLIDRVLRAGGLIYRTHPLGYVYERRIQGHTWDAGLDYFLRGSGTQWAGLPRYAEFGTVQPTCTPEAGGTADPAPDVRAQSPAAGIPVQRL